MKVVIIEDERPIADELARMLRSIEPATEVLAMIPSATKAVQWFKQNRQALPDLVFMDIHLEDTRAFRIFEEVDITSPVIFTTAFDQYVMQGLKNNGIDYLLKPIGMEELKLAVEKYKSLSHHFSQPGRSDLSSRLAELLGGDYKKRFMVTVGNRIESIAASEIAYFFVEFKSVSMMTHDKRKFPLSISLDALTSMVDPKEFFRISRQMLISHASIRSIHITDDGRLRAELIPSFAEEAIVSSDRVTAFKEWLGK